MHLVPTRGSSRNSRPVKVCKSRWCWTRQAESTCKRPPQKSREIKHHCKGQKDTRSIVPGLTNGVGREVRRHRNLVLPRCRRTSEVKRSREWAQPAIARAIVDLAADIGRALAIQRICLGECVDADKCALCRWRNGAAKGVNAADGRLRVFRARCQGVQAVPALTRSSKVARRARAHGARSVARPAVQANKTAFGAGRAGPSGLAQARAVLEGR